MNQNEKCRKFAEKCSEFCQKFNEFANWLSNEYKEMHDCQQNKPDKKGEVPPHLMTGWDIERKLLFTSSSYAFDIARKHNIPILEVSCTEKYLDPFDVFYVFVRYKDLYPQIYNKIKKFIQFVPDLKKLWDRLLSGDYDHEKMNKYLIKGAEVSL